MNGFSTKIDNLLRIFRQYRWMLLPVIPALFLTIFLIGLAFQPTPRTQQTQPIPTSAVSVPLLTPLPTDAWSDYENEWEEQPETLSGFERKEARPDGTTLYIYTSTNPKRPDITIRNPDNSIVFYREQGTKEVPLMQIPLIRETYGEPDEIIQGSTYYGPQIQIYFYESIHTAYVVNPQTNETYEVHFFPPMSAEEYLQRYKELN